MSGGDAIKTKLSKFFMNIINPQTKSQLPDVPKTPPPSRESTSCKSALSSSSLYENVKPQLSDMEPEQLDCSSVEVETDNKSVIFHGGSDLDDYIEDDYCIDYSSSDNETFYHTAISHSSSQGVRMGVSSLRRFSNGFPDSSKNLFCPLGQKIEADDRSVYEDFEDSFSDIFPKNFDNEESVLESVSGQTSNLLEYMSVSAFDAKEMPDVLMNSSTTEDLPKTPDFKTPNKTPERPTKGNGSVKIEKDIGVYFYLGDPLDQIDPETPKAKVIERSETSEPCADESRVESSRKSLSEIVKGSPGFPTSPQKHIYRPSSRRDSGYVSKSGSPRESPDENDGKISGIKVKRLIRNKTYIVGTIFSYPTVGPNAGSCLDKVDGLETKISPKKAKQTSALRPLVEINEISPVKRPRSPKIPRSNSFTMAIEQNKPDLLKPKSRRSICLQDDATVIKAPDLKLHQKSPSMKSATSDSSLISSTPSAKGSVQTEWKTAIESPLVDEFGRKISPVKLLGKLKSFKSSSALHQLGGKRRHKTGENSSSECRPGKKYRKRRPKPDKENTKPGKGDAKKFNDLVPDYILLKRMTEEILVAIPGYPQLCRDFNREKLIDYLYDFFHKEMEKLNTPNIKNIQGFRKLKSEQARISPPCAIECSKVIQSLLTAFLLNDATLVRDCRNFVFKNLTIVAKTCPQFLTAPPELVTLLLSNEDVAMVNSQGFPLGYNDSELEVMKVVKKYIELRKDSKLEVDHRVKRILLSVTDKSALDARGCTSPATSVLQRSISLTYSALQVSDTGESNRSPYKKLTNRPYHEIRYETSSPCTTADLTRQEYLLQALLSPTPRSPADRDSDIENCSPAGSKDALQVCSRSNLLRKIFVCYRMEDQQPRISGIELQYSCEEKRRRKRLVIGETLKTSDNVTTGTDTSDSGASRRSSVQSDQGAVKDKVVVDTVHVGCGESDQQDPGCRRSRSFLLRRGEHIIGVNVRGEKALRNLELTTSLGRRHCLLPSDTSDSPWRAVSLPLGGSPHCLQALYADVKTSGSQTTIRSVGAVWAVTSRPLNNLNV